VIVVALSELHHAKGHDRAIPEKPSIRGSPTTPRHRLALRASYLLVGATGGLGKALSSANLPQSQGVLGLTPVEGTWLPAAYVIDDRVVDPDPVQMPSGIRIASFERRDFLTFGQTAPAFARGGAVLAQGRRQGWTSDRGWRSR
jgi:hypothetical protein